MGLSSHRGPVDPGRAPAARRGVWEAQLAGERETLAMVILAMRQFQAALDQLAEVFPASVDVTVTDAGRQGRS